MKQTKKQSLALTHVFPTTEQRYIGEQQTRPRPERWTRALGRSMLLTSKNSNVQNWQNSYKASGGGDQPSAADKERIYLCQGLSVSYRYVREWVAARAFRECEDQETGAGCLQRNEQEVDVAG